MGAALWEAEIWSSSRTAPAGMAQSQGKLEMAGKGLLPLAFGFRSRGGTRIIILSFFYFNKIFRSPGSGPGRDIQRVITSHADAAKIGRKIADEVRRK